MKDQQTWRSKKKKKINTSSKIQRGWRSECVIFSPYFPYLYLQVALVFFHYHIPQPKVFKDRSSDYLFHSDDNSSEDIQKEPNHPLTRPSFFKSLTSLSTLGRPSHDYGNGRTSISSNDARQSFNKSRVSSNGQGKYVIGAGFSYMDTASPSPTPSAGNLSESPVITPVVAKTNLDTTYTHHQHAHHHRHNHSHQGTRAISGSDEEDDVWSADIDDIPGDSGTSANRKSIKVDKTQLYPSLAGLTLENKTENEEFSRFAGKSGSI